jgi:hypothetical protein
VRRRPRHTPAPVQSEHVYSSANPLTGDDLDELCRILLSGLADADADEQHGDERDVRAEQHGDERDARAAGDKA